MEKEIILKNSEKEKYEVELMKLIKLFPRSPDQEFSSATKIVFINETRDIYDHLNFIAETFIQQSHLIGLYHKYIKSNKIS